jgi:DNA-binding response OmpR family regulator
MTDATGKKILVVDDEADVVTFLTTLLEDNGYSVIQAADGKEGFAKAKAEQPDLIVLDISMPEETGVRMYRNLKENTQTASIPVVMLTGVSHEFKRFIETRRQVPPPNGYFDKPPDRAEFLAKVNELIGKRAASAGVN